LLKAGIKTPYFKVVSPSATLEKDLLDVFRSLPPTTVVKPYNSGSSLGISLSNTFEELKRGVAKAFEYAPKVLVEEFIGGKEGTLAVIDHFRGKEHYPLFPVEIRPRGKSFFDFEAKYSGMSDEIVPGNFSKDEVAQIQEAVLNTHRTLGLRHYSRTDFIIHPKRGVFILETNTLPGLTETSLFPKSLSAVGLSLPGFLEHVIHLALNK
jgi:D-alanine-D-alanine ligase